MDLAVVLVADIEDMLRSQGATVPLIASSGNGQYLLYRIDLPNDAASLDAIKRFYAGLQHMLAPYYDPATAGVSIDVTVGNAARILRVGGTTNRKGDPLPDRPHRVCTYHTPDPDYPIEVLA